MDKGDYAVDRLLGAQTLKIHFQKLSYRLHGGKGTSMRKIYQLSIRCYFPGKPDNYTQHYPEISLKELPKWIEAYSFTHETLESVSVKIWVKKEGEL